MKKRFSFGVASLLMILSLTACGNNTNTQDNTSKANPTTSSTTKVSSSSVDQGPKKSVQISSITLSSQSNKAYITVTGTQSNYTAENFKWAWGLKNRSTGDFADGKERPAEADYQIATFDANNSFTVKYCLTDILTLKSGVLYRIYGGTPESYGDIQFESNNFGASDATRKYYLRSDEENSLVYDSIQPLSFTKASVVNVEEADLPTGVTNAGPYIRFGGTNSKNLTLETINGWHTAGNIAGNFQRVINGEYLVHDHVDEERFWKIEDNNVYFYCYIGFIEPTEGWMVHFDLVEGNSNSNLQFDSTINGVSYTVGEKTYKVYADKSKGGADNYWGCLGVLREA